MNVFKYPDTNSSRAGIEKLNYKFRGLKICIIGMGGTGSYILDMVSKTPVAEIHIYDGDIFQLHNAFRAPGATPAAKFDEQDELNKVDYYHAIYGEMHNGIFPHAEYVNAEHLEGFEKFDFIFISVDKNAVRFELTNKLAEMSMPFIDAGLGINSIGDSLIGTLRVTLGTPDKYDHLSNRIGKDEYSENQYATNIQIADLNCLNATLAVLEWKKFIGFYQNLKSAHNVLYFINTGKLLNEDFAS